MSHPPPVAGVCKDCPSGEARARLDARSVGELGEPDHVGGGAGVRRPSRQPIAAMAIATTTPPATVVARERQGGEAAGGALALGPGTAPTTSAGLSASANFSAVPNRSAGSFASALRIAASMASARYREPPRGAVGRSVSTLATMVCTVGPVNGGSPTTISYATALQRVDVASGVDGLVAHRLLRRHVLRRP